MAATDRLSAPVPASVVAAQTRRDLSASVGQSLDRALRLRMEARLALAERAIPAGISPEFANLEATADTASRGELRASVGPATDFSNVRLHVDEHAASAARRLGARAVTIGQHVYADPALLPATSGDRDDIIAHELAHVVQQRQLGRTFIQPRLIALGDDDHVRRFIALAEPAMGEGLQRDAATREIRATGPLPSSRRSPAFATAMHRIMDDPSHNAEVRIGVEQPDTLIGRFPAQHDMKGIRIQQVDIDDIEAIEAKAPGTGLAALVHELVENYEAQLATAVSGDDLYPEAHQLAGATESDVAEELVGAGRRIAQANHEDGNRGSTVADFQTYYVVVDYQTDPRTRDRRVIGTRRAPPATILESTIDHYVTGSPDMPAAGAAGITAAAAAVRANDLATVRIEGFADAVGSESRNRSLSTRRADQILFALATAGVADERMHAVGLGEKQPVAPNDTEANRAQNRRVVITVARPGP